MENVPFIWSGCKFYEFFQSWMIISLLAHAYLVLLHAAEMLDKTTGMQATQAQVFGAQSRSARERGP